MAKIAEKNCSSPTANSCQKESSGLLSSRESKLLGSVYTPPKIAQMLTNWAIRNPTDNVLDVGIGEGVFVFSAYQKLLELGNNLSDSQQQLYGAEIHTETFNTFCRIARQTNLDFSNLRNADFFETDFPEVDVVVGNPPYIRRTYINNIEKIRSSVLAENFFTSQLNMTRMTDMNIYFLLRAIPKLKKGGRLAVITSDAWLNASYGIEFKKYIQECLDLEYLVSLDKRVFHDALVKPVMILATKKKGIKHDKSMFFMRIKGERFPGNPLFDHFDLEGAKHSDVSYFKVKNQELNPDSPWGMYFKAPTVYDEIMSHGIFAPFGSLANTRIGLQTLAKDFFVLSRDKVIESQIEKEYIRPLAQSSQYQIKTVIEASNEPMHYVFFCSDTRDKLSGTNALKHILNGEKTRVPVRGKNITVIGYQNKERIIKARRKCWYDLKTDLVRRGVAPILIPRLLYRNYSVIWNKAAYIPGELFIEFTPILATDIEVYLAILTSTITEIALRSNAQLYGGGTYNISPGQMKNICILDPNHITLAQRNILKEAFLIYLNDVSRNRQIIDSAIYRILGISSDLQIKIQNTIQDLLSMATSSKGGKDFG